MRKTKGYRVVAFGCAAYLTDESAGKAKAQLVNHAKSFGWGGYENYWADISRCTRWRQGDGKDPGCYIVRELNERGVEMPPGDWWTPVCRHGRNFLFYCEDCALVYREERRQRELDERIRILSYLNHL